MTSAEVAALVRQARDGASSLRLQHQAFERLVRAFEEMTLRTALRLLDHPEDARDATQEAFLLAWRKLRCLEVPEAFGAWLARLVATCSRRRRRARSEVAVDASFAGDAVSALERVERRQLLARAMGALSAEEQRVLLLFYWLGEPIDRIAASLGVPRGTVGKRLHTARLRMRRALPPELRREIVRQVPAPELVRRVRAGIYDEYVGEYRFATRPELVVAIERERGTDRLVSVARGQRNVLAAAEGDFLMTVEYDGEGRFVRDRQGRVTHFVYYEFGARLGVAAKER